MLQVSARLEKSLLHHCPLFFDIVPTMTTTTKVQNKSNTSAEYIRRINKALKFIEDHLDHPIQLDDIASASHFSSYHFHRIFHALVGETVNDYVSRKRMEKSVRRLLHKPALSVTEVSVAGGYSSSANFSKAFKLYFGLSPTELRKGKYQNADNNENSKNGKFYRKYGEAFYPQDLYSQFVTQSEAFDLDKLEDMLMQVKVEEIQKKRIAYLTAPKGYELNAIFETWDKIIHWAELKGVDEKTQKRFAICHDNPLITPETKCRYDAAIVVKHDVAIVPPYNQAFIPSGKYATAYYKDDADKINSFITEICSHWLPNSGYEPDDYPIIFNYLNDSREDGYVEMNVYIKVKNLVLS